MANKIIVILLVGLIGLVGLVGIGGLIGLSRDKTTNVVDENDLSSLRDAYSVARKDRTSVWLSYKSCYVFLHKGGGEPSNRLSAFDIDDTITKAKSGPGLPENNTDWRYLAPNTKERVQQSVRDGQRLAFFTNQNLTLESVQARLQATAEGLELPSATFVALNHDEFRKPQKGMYELLVKAFNDDKQIDLDSSFYCGDAIDKDGAPSFADSDLKFAQAIGLPFLDPEAFLRGDQPKKV